MQRRTYIGVKFYAYYLSFYALCTFLAPTEGTEHTFVSVNKGHGAPKPLNPKFNWELG